MTQEWFLTFFPLSFSMTTLKASSIASLTPKLFIAEHSMNLLAPIFFARPSPSAVFMNASEELEPSLRSVFVARKCNLRLNFLKKICRFYVPTRIYGIGLHDKCFKSGIHLLDMFSNDGLLSTA